MALQIRPAQVDDAGVVVPLIYSSGPAAFDYVFAHRGVDAQGFLRRAFVDGAGEFGFDNHVVGEHDGRVVAVGAGFDRASAAAFMLPAARQILQHFGAAGIAPVLRGLRTERVIRPPAGGEFYLGHLGVAPAWRGHGYGSELVDWFVRQAIQQDCAAVVLDVAADNPRARALYERLGFRVTGENRTRLANRHGAVPNQYRMRRDLRA